MGYSLAVGRRESVLNRAAQDQVLGQGERGLSTGEWGMISPGSVTASPAALPTVSHVGTMVAL